ncbi:MAG: hypothetical protein UV74_C0002G0032 [Candidatus Woesebacteria bacterium GW2011_GWB1_43_14]|uniref:Trimeric autotransporter adhesin YadA-like head domain-containing protein n=1 Tax=Candidatus Woesebacteria bacterium GW2011_GWB1_43_14 TaxID=1618578 RepID=A0A0G1GJ67_9BACT|nr:MAG: hypothetical protein UV51_C0004G0079 [Candidatus Woesebacteria bacterium GW2011_GWC1_42_9]KKS98813.1 MAG: hypothetical protein UV74_C0002G0032 [Candidatus Woesebacteria bacterium GW2011_GWB1_43_14]
MRSIKLQISFTILLSLIFLLSTPTEASAVIQNLNGATGQTQTFQNDSNVTINSNNDVHSLGWTGFLPASRGGTGVGSFTAGSVLFSNGTTSAQDNSNFFWDNVNNRLGIGTATPSAALEVSGNAKVTSLTSTNDSTINGLTVGKGGGSRLYSTAVGVNALSNNTTGDGNTAIGYYALGSNNVQGSNTAVGTSALWNLIGGEGHNTAVGSGALGATNVTASYSVAVGDTALYSNTSGTQNTAVGSGSLYSNTTGNNNTALGYASMVGNTTGSGNVAIGHNALFNNTTGAGNTAIGLHAARYQADGSSGLHTANDSIYIGFLARGYDDNDTNSIVLGASAIGAGANTAVIGNSSMTDVYFGSSSANANTHAKKMYLGSPSIPGCIIMGDSDGSGVTYLTVNDGVLSASTTAPSACQ